jgi:polynucleotide 5'-hydroxyl-kinase GRC3/NOL9
VITGWPEVVEAVLREPGTVVMLGGVDVGKTTAATTLASSAVRAGRCTALVDADVGQSDLGPPTTVGMGMLRGPVEAMDQVSLTAAYFVGDTSPAAAPRYLIDGATRMVGQARARGAQVVVVDTAGWVEGEAAVAAGARMIHRMAARHVIAIQRAGEVEPVLARVAPAVAVYRVAPSSHVRRRSQEERRAFREERFARYFRTARRVSLDLGALRADRPAVYAGRRVPQERMLAQIPAGLLRHLLVGLADRKGDLTALGTVVGVHLRARRVSILTPLRSLAGIEMLQWGAMRVHPSGREEGRLSAAA